MPTQPQTPTQNAKGLYVQEFTGAATILRDDGSTFRNRFHSNAEDDERKSNIYFPFKSRKEAELALLFDDLDISAGAIDRILKLEIIRELDLSFKTAKAMKQLFEQLPQGPSWKWETFVFPGYSTEEPIIVYYRDGLECLESLIADPRFVNELDLVPRKEYETMDPKTGKLSNRVFSEYTTADLAWECQKALPAGAAQAGVILSSDKTQLSRGTGNACAHPLTISTTAIKSSTRNALSAHAFMLAALIPIPKYLAKARKVCAVLEQRILHKTYDLVSVNLKKAARSGHLMSDAVGRVRNFYTPLASKVIDSGVDPDDIKGFAKACKKYHLSGVSEPFWRDWAHSDPFNFLTPDALHGLHKEFWDHEVKWAIAALGKEELNFRYGLLQPRIGIRHFNRGVAGLKQCTGREQRDIQKSLVAVIDGDVPEGFVSAVRALMDFRYRIQSEHISESDIVKIESALAEFHQHKDVISDSKYRTVEGWAIPKIERFHHFVRSVRLSGACHQWSTDRTESAHIELVKRPYERTPRGKNFSGFICRHMDRKERTRSFTTFVTLELVRRRKKHRHKLVSPSNRRRKLPKFGAIFRNTVSQSHESQDSEADLDDCTFTLSPTEIEDEDLNAPRRTITDYFADAQRATQLRVANLGTLTARDRSRVPYSFSTPSTAFHFNYEPDVRTLSIEEASARFRLPDLRAACLEFYGPQTEKTWLIGGARQPDLDAPLGFTHIHVWYTVKVQTYDVNGRVQDARSVQAAGRCDDLPKGRFDTCLIINSRKFQESWDGTLDVKKEHFVGQIRLLFMPIWENSSSLIQFHPHLAYVERFDIIPQVQADKRSRRAPNLLTGMFALRRALRTSGGRMGGIVDVRNIRMPAELIPRFGGIAEPTLTVHTAMERSAEFWLNKFSSKDLFFRLDKT
ncbi:hypothetical protein SISNIDRAFT_419538 [Sistotremastrum niveocremeum HHB9708]|uniref:DUF6830 domain-containing protein n=1 Tax=Sistotremastrum niveocremeum HHB9708 TaxID=1314777 RepID=A0A164N8P8_9AGAM|nr:hypothetical protein SISNIDRAFT_419538 [Sistotremastrum niveocremeum HHB9708]